MTRHPTARRVHRQNDAPDDVFVARVLETTAWAKQHARALIIGGIVAAVALIALVVTLNQRAERRSEAAAQLTQVRALAMSGNAELAIRDLEAFLARFDGTPAAREARLLLGRSYMEAGQAQRAIETARPLAEDPSTVMGVNAAFLLAAGHEAAQEPHRAEEVFLEVADEAPYLYQQQEALDNAARIRLQRGDAAAAAELYQRLLDMTPEGNAERPVYELRLGEALAQAAGGAGAAGAASATQAEQAPAATTN